ncbi:YkgJ family cysteine cluster protein [uncultured Pseudomonas sp.]|uniref:YkgJ family cysteine cluster protein n=1 Tax=uncultured Pseudomonas sp. TaxID=114707 RepID=UPI0025CF4099|nr:YkgJ family cysteine cluster protein [uncultured Pseudomonas sp.]
MECRPGCGACCIAPSISSPLPRMPQGKPSGVRCAHLDATNRCDLFGSPLRPAVCGGFQAELAFCGNSSAEAMAILLRLEGETAA